MRLPTSLTSRLVVTTVALVALVCVGIGAATTLVMHNYLSSQLDDDVRSSVRRADGPPDEPRGRPGSFERDDDDPLGAPFIGNQAPGTLIALIALGDARILDDNRDDDDVVLDAGTVDLLAGIPVDGDLHTVEIPDHGTYRVAAVATTGGTLVTGLPTRDVDDAISSLLLLEVMLTLTALVAAALAGRAVVRRQLAPLREVAETAHAVAALPLASGEIELTERVPAHLTDERTEVGQVGAALNTLLAHVESSLDARHESEQRVRQFVADASHELRTPLTTIAGYTELARRRPDDAAAAATALAKVADESTRMTALVEDLLLLARLDSGRPLERSLVDLTRLLLEAVSDARVVAPEHRWRLDLPDEAVEVSGDEQRLHQVVTNLLTNARKYTPSGTTVTVTARADGFSVHDDGPGFPAALVPHAFERFARGDAARVREGGVGLGLALVDAIVTAHGGRVDLTSTPGDTTIDVTLR